MIVIEFTEQEAADMATGFTYPAEIRDKFIRALPAMNCRHCEDDPPPGHTCPACGRRAEP